MSDDVRSDLSEFAALDLSDVCELESSSESKVRKDIERGEYESYLDGRKRKITLRSFKARRERLLNAQTPSPTIPPPPRRSKQEAAAKMHPGLTPQPSNVPPLAKHGAIGLQGKRSQNATSSELTYAFTDDIAKKTGKHRATVARKAARAKKVAVLSETAGTSLDTGSEIDALAKLPEAEQSSLAEAVKRGEQVSHAPNAPAAVDHPSPNPPRRPQPPPLNATQPARAPRAPQPAPATPGIQTLVLTRRP
jgi:hypothetical protein